MALREIESRLPPGFRFHPSDEELVCCYLRDKVAQANGHRQTPPPLISPTTMVEVDLHAREPWELPEVAKLGAEEWYFLSFRDRKYAKGSRRNRATTRGYWKATGKDKDIVGGSGSAVVGMRKTLVFYLGRAPSGRKTGWIMHEFRLAPSASPPSQEDWVLCRVFHRGKGEADQQQLSSNSRHTITGPSSSSASPVVVTLSSPPAAAASALHRRRLMFSWPPVTHDDGLQLDDDGGRDHQLVVHQDDQSDVDQLLDLGILHSADMSFLELEQAGLSMLTTETEMESLATSTYGALQGGNYSANGVYF